MKIEYVQTEDIYYCDTCGYSYAYGAEVYFDDKLAYRFVPRAHCFGGDDIGSDDVYKEIFKLLGHELEVA